MSFNPFEKFFAKDKDVYEKLWEKVEQARKKDLPRDALKGSEAIYKQALHDQDFAQLMKSWIVIVETKTDLDPEELHLKELIDVPHTGPVQDAIYHAIVGSAYKAQQRLSYYQTDDDSQNNYDETAGKHFSAVLVDKEALSAESAANYSPLMKHGDDSRIFNHDLLSVLARFVMEQSGMDSEKKYALTSELADFYRSKDNREAATLYQLESLIHHANVSDYNQRLSSADFDKQLRELYDASQGLEAQADVAGRLVTRLDRDAKLDFCRAFLAACPKAFNAETFQGIIEQELRPSFHLSTDYNIVAGQPFGVSMSYENLYDVNLTVRLFNGYKHGHILNLDGKVILSRDYKLGTDSLCVARHAQGYPTKSSLNDKLTLPAGKYVFIAKSGGLSEETEVDITSLRLIYFRMPGDKVLALVRNNETGRPVPNASVRISARYNNSQKATEFACDENGEVLFPAELGKDLIVAFIPGTDDETPSAYISNPSRLSKKTTETRVQLFTDRAIYRPGQTVHVTGISYSQLADETWVNPSRSLTLTLFDANHRKAGTLAVTTNRLGSLDGEFVLPKDVMPGQFSIKSDDASVSFRVEEYKRPTFTVTARNADSQGRTFSFGDTIQVEALAKTYSGVPVQDAKVHYTIQTARVEFWRWWEASWTTLDEGEIRSNDAGIATAQVYLDPTRLSEYDNDKVRYRVTFDVTDQGGETHSDSYELSLSRRAFMLQASVSTYLDYAQDDAEFLVEAMNANREEVSCTGTYKICIEGTKEVVASGEFHAGTRTALPKLQAGSYTLQVSAMDRSTEITDEATFHCYDSRLALDLNRDRQPKADAKAATRFSEDLLRVINSNFGPDSDGLIYFSPQEDDVLVGYHIVSNDSVIERHQCVVGRHLVKLAIPYREEYGDGVNLMIYYVRNGHAYCEHKTFTYVQPNKQLKLSWSTFRDRLYPGQEETWTLRITDPAGSPVADAELFATMYDGSLDALTSHSWNLWTSCRRYIQTGYYGRTTSANTSYGLSFVGPYSHRNYPERRFTTLNEYVHNSWERQRSILYSRDRVDLMPVGMAMPRAMMMEKSMAMADSDLLEAEMVQEEVEANSNAASAPELEPEPVIRSNFAETAFFYPHLLSDEQGQVSISFTLPESLTEWKFLGLAHDKDVRVGTIKATTVARKDFMVQPNLPRFVRSGDHATIAARVINQCESAIEGTARLRLLDAETEAVVTAATLPVSVEAGKTTSVTFDFMADESHPMLIAEVVVTAGQTSDGERHYLPVLTSKRHVTEAMPFYVLPEDSAKQIDVSWLFNSNSPTATQKRLVLEYTEHPEWTIIQALEGLKLPEFENAPCYAASLYANVMASRLAQRIPGFEQALQSALAQQEAQGGINAQLAISDELRELLLKDSPWVIEALSEDEQRAHLLDLFNQELMDQRITKAIAHLKKLQHAKGAWSWFEGMGPSYYITLSTCENLVMLHSENPEVDQMLTRALGFLDNEEYEEYQQRKKDKLPVQTGESTLHYLYVCSFMPERKVSKDIQKMQKAMLDELEKSVRELTIQGRCVAACVLRAYGRKRVADDFLESAVQYSVTKPGMGRYYASDLAYYSWRDYRIPTQLAAIRALQLSPRADREDLCREMLLWLLRQKQTQMWDNPINTIGAVNCLLSQSEGNIAAVRTSDAAPCFKLDQTLLPTQLDTTRFLAEQLGYVRTQLPDEVFSQGIQTLEVTPASHQQADGALISWGAVYAQYLEDMDRLANQSTGELAIDFRLLDADGKTLDPSQPLHVGDAVTIRVSIKADRDMDFVHVNCQRPSCLEPDEQLSGFRWLSGLGGYVAQHDASTDIFFDRFRRGTYTLDLHFHVDRIGEYLTGIATAQCAYAPEFCAHTAAQRLSVK